MIILSCNQQKSDGQSKTFRQMRLGCRKSNRLDVMTAIVSIVSINANHFDTCDYLRSHRESTRNPDKSIKRLSIDRSDVQSQKRTLHRINFRPTDRLSILFYAGNKHTVELKQDGVSVLVGPRPINLGNS